MADRLSIILADPEQRAKWEARFWSHVDRSGGPDACWPWMFTRNKMGYGQLGCGRKQKLKAHRVAWRLTHGNFPEPCGLHRCDNPPCCNPSHLFEGTRTENMADKMRKGRGAAPPVHRGANHHNAKFDDAAVMAIIADGRTQRRIAEQYGVSEMTIYRIKKGKSRCQSTHGR